MSAGAEAERSRAARLPFAREGTSAGLLAAATSTPVLAVLVTLITWQPLQVRPAAGLDPSWASGLTMATHRGLDFGTQVIFTYGPLGFLRYQLAMYGGLAVLSTIYVLAVRIGLAATVLWAARRTLPLPVAVIVALAASLISTPDAIVVIVFLVCAAAISDRPPRATVPMVVYGGAAVSAIELLVKLNSGVLVLALCLVTVLALEGRRLANLLRFLAVFVTAFAILWFATGQGVGNLYDYFRTAFDMISGYSAAMALTTGRRWAVVAAVAFGGATLVATILAARRLPRARGVGFVALVVVLSFVSWKEGFVREDPVHVQFFFSWMLAPWLALTWIRGWGRAVGLAGVGLAVVLFYATTGFFPAENGFLKASLNPFTNAKAAVNNVHDLVDPSARGAARDEARQALIAQYQLDPQTLRMIGSNPVDVYPSEASTAWAYSLNWDPQPVFQTYTAYTPLLDDRNADALSSPDGPRLVLRQPIGSLDGRYPLYDTPAATLAMLCNFEPLRTTPGSQLLGRVADRCGASRRLSSVDANYGQTVQVPQPPGPREAVFARVSGTTPTGIERLRALLIRPTVRWVVVDGKFTYRFVTANAEDGLIVSIPPSIDYGHAAPPPSVTGLSWNLAPNAETLTFEKNGGIASPDNRLRIDFYEMPVRPAR